MRRVFILIGSILLLLALLIAAWEETHRLKPVAIVPTLTGQVEYCLTCHADVATISASHPVQTFGCVLCHGGERLALDATLAHSTLRGGANPSDFSVVQASCGGSSCHSGEASLNNNHIQRATTSIQATYAGAIASILYTYGAQPDLNARYGVTAVEDPLSTSGLTGLQAFDPANQGSPMVVLFAQNCLNCHLSAQPPAGSAYTRFTGCAACHSPTQSSGTTIQVHKLTTAIPYTQCDTCHNRGNYDLRTMTFVPRSDLPADRLHAYYQPIAQFTTCEYKLECIDCHTRDEAMGDGSLYANKLDIQYIQCQTCHGTAAQLPLTRTLTDPNDLAFRMAQLNPVLDLKLGDTILVTDKGEELWNVRLLADGTYELFDKATGERFTFRPVKGSGCQQDPARQDSASCHLCHSVQR
jgi:hypothetical protein